MIRLGVIGGGIMGERLLLAAQGHAEVQVSGVWDPSPAAMARLAGVLPGLPALPSAQAVIEAADCVYVASPPATHLLHARAALDAGRAVFCEKPLATDVGDAARFVQAARGARMAVNFPFASAPAVARLGAWLAEGAVGVPWGAATPIGGGATGAGSAAPADAWAHAGPGAPAEPSLRAGIEVAFARWPRGWQHAAAGWLDGTAEGGFTREVVSHFLFLARRLLGPLVLLEARAAFPEAGRSERGLRATLQAGGVPMTLSGSVGQTAVEDSNRFTLEGPAGAIRLRDWAFAERLADGAWEGDAQALPHAVSRPLVLQRQLSAVAAMTRGEPHPLATLEEAFEVQGVVEAMLAG